MACLTKVQIFEAKDIKMEKVSVPEWADSDPDAYVMVKALTASEQDSFDKTIILVADGAKKASTDMTDYRAKRAAFCMCDDEGNRLFTAADIPELSGKSAKALQRVLEADQKLNGNVEEMEKN
jgi:hypothetical protein